MRGQLIGVEACCKDQVYFGKLIEDKHVGQWTFHNCALKPLENDEMRKR